ncbi:MAG: hypothetical protein L3J36_02465 [Rhodobacteraceae bacterium]|nr:hypothetical protein [Paracoccaceae bacterium]
MRGFLILTFAFWAGSVQAQVNLAQNGLQATIKQLASDPDAHGFELGMLRTLRAVEKTLQARYEYGLGQSLANLPLLRLDTGGVVNPSPTPTTPATLSRIMDGFVSDIGTARAALEHAEVAGIQPFEMTLGDIWFDINANGTRQDTESAIATLGEVVLGRRAFRDFGKSDQASQPLTIRFDAADHAWLLAYTHMLSGVGNLFMAFDPEPVLRDLMHQREGLKDAPEIANYYDPEEIQARIETLEPEIAALKSQLAEMDQDIASLSGVIKNLSAKVDETEDSTQKAKARARLAAKMHEQMAMRSEQRQVRPVLRLMRNELDAARSKLAPVTGEIQQMVLQQQAAIDMIYVAIKSLAQQPDAARIRAVHTHLTAMIAHNRVFWDRVAKETDNDHEWIPNPSQTSALPLTIPPGLAAGWQAILKDIKAVLEGKLLIPHPVLPEGYGISLPAYVADPTPLDLVNWLHGIGAYRHAAIGPRLSIQNWRTFQRLSLGNAGGFALLFN